MANEYSWLLEFYTYIVAFPVITGTFDKLTKEEFDNLMIEINILKIKLDHILPIVQDRKNEAINVR